ncbi:unnamed protein product [Toxocara canis]|uniref:Elf4 domain-containing protein n=1 Tax=Toxocara canis TaxID=6265 RepID=A0A183VDJ6_TOXCA|nr:unnamed protein product [Toxocara canis]
MFNPCGGRLFGWGRDYCEILADSCAVKLEINACLLELEQAGSAFIRHLRDSFDDLRRILDHYLDGLARIRHLQAQLRGSEGVREARDPDALVHRPPSMN